MAGEIIVIRVQRLDSAVLWERGKRPQAPGFAFAKLIWLGGRGAEDTGDSWD